MKRPDAKLLLDMLLSARAAEAYLRGVDRHRLDDDVLLQNAVVRRVEIIGEAAARVSQDAAALIMVQDILDRLSRAYSTEMYVKKCERSCTGTSSNDMPGRGRALYDERAA